MKDNAQGCSTFSLADSGLGSVSDQAPQRRAGIGGAGRQRTGNIAPPCQPPPAMY